MVSATGGAGGLSEFNRVREQGVEITDSQGHLSKVPFKPLTGKLETENTVSKDVADKVVAVIKTRGLVARILPSSENDKEYRVIIESLPPSSTGKAVAAVAKPAISAAGSAMRGAASASAAATRSALSSRPVPPAAGAGAATVATGSPAAFVAEGASTPASTRLPAASTPPPAATPGATHSLRVAETAQEPKINIAALRTKSRSYISKTTKENVQEISREHHKNLFKVLESVDTISVFERYKIIKGYEKKTSEFLKTVKSIKNEEEVGQKLFNIFSETLDEIIDLSIQRHRHTDIRSDAEAEKLLTDMDPGSWCVHTTPRHIGAVLSYVDENGEFQHVAIPRDRVLDNVLEQYVVKGEALQVESGIPPGKTPAVPKAAEKEKVPSLEASRRRVHFGEEGIRDSICSDLISRCDKRLSKIKEEGSDTAKMRQCFEEIIDEALEDIAMRTKSRAKSESEELLAAATRVDELVANFVGRPDYDEGNFELLKKFYYTTVFPELASKMAPLHPISSERTSIPSKAKDPFGQRVLLATADDEVASPPVRAAKSSEKMKISEKALEAIQEAIQTATEEYFEDLDDFDDLDDDDYITKIHEAVDNLFDSHPDMHLSEASKKRIQTNIRVELNAFLNDSKNAKYISADNIPGLREKLVDIAKRAIVLA